MDLFATIKQDAVAFLHTTANALKAQFAMNLAQAGHAVTADDHVSALVSTAVSASAATNKPAGAGVAPNYADHALATFQTSMTAAMLQFAAAHLPAKFQHDLAAGADVVNNVLDAVEGAAPLNLRQDAQDVTKVAADLVSIVPGAAPVVAVIEPVVLAAESLLPGSDEPAALPEPSDTPGAVTETPEKPEPPTPAAPAAPVNPLVEAAEGLVATGVEAAGVPAEFAEGVAQVVEAGFADLASAVGL